MQNGFVICFSDVVSFLALLNFAVRFPGVIKLYGCGGGGTLTIKADSAFYL